MIKYDAVFITHRGNPAFDNQDSLLIDRRVIHDTSMDAVESLEDSSESLLCAVADGVSSSKHSALASRLALEFLRGYVDDVDTFRAMPLAERIQNTLATHAIKYPKHHGMATTLAGIFIDGKTAHVFNTGDSRVYRIRHNKLTRLSKDHTQAQMMLDRGEISPDEFATCADVYNMLEGYFVADELEDDELLIHHQNVIVEPDDCFLICTDGITDVIPDERLEEILAGRDAMQTAHVLFTTALSYRHDNLSLIIVRSLS